MNRGRGRGRGSGGRGRHRTPAWSRPKLPAKLAKELLEGETFGKKAQGISPGRKERRKHERLAKRGDAQSPASTGGRPGEREPSRKPQHYAKDELQEMAGPRPGKRPRTEAQAVKPPSTAKRVPGGAMPVGAPAAFKASKGSGSNFASLLPVGGVDAERALQQELARKLGLKKGRKEKSLDDGLEDLLEGFGGVEDDEPELGSQQRLPPSRSRQHAQQQQQQGRAGPGSDGEGSELTDGFASHDELTSEEEEGEDGSSQGEGSDSDLEGALLGGSGGDSEMGGSDSEVRGSDSEMEDGGNEGNAWGEDPESDPQGGAEPGSRGVSSGDGSEGEQLSSSDSEGGQQGGAGSRQAIHRMQQAQGGRGRKAAAAAVAPGARDEAGGVGGGKYIPPAVRRALEGGGGEGEEGEEAARMSRRVRGLLNRLAETNIQGIVSELAALYESEGRRVVSDAVCAELLQAAAEGPRASDRFAAVTAAAVAGLAGSTHSAEIIANFLDRLASRLDGASSAGESLTSHNLAMVAASLYSCGALRPDLLYSLLNRLKARFTETDVSLMAVLLKAGGLQLRADDPVAMKDFVVSVHARAAEAGGVSSLTKRGQSMLELVVDIKNNRKREGSGKGAPSVLSPAVTKWLKSRGVSELSIGGITWDKVLTKNKKGIWWQPAAADAVPQEPAARAALRAAASSAVDKEGGLGGPELLKLAAALRMNTDVRRAVFCIVMGSEDCMDAFEKLLRLPLKGEQEREVVRVTVECCLQERAWNPYYALLLLKMCEASKSHRITLQFCVWDQLKEVEEGELEVRRMTNLARLFAEVVVGGALPSTTLKVVEFSQGMSPREVLFWRIFFQHLLTACKSQTQVVTLFQKITSQSQLKQFRTGLAVFLRRVFGPWLAAKQPGESSGLSDAHLATLLSRLQAVEKVLGTSMS